MGVQEQPRDYRQQSRTGVAGYVLLDVDGYRHLSRSWVAVEALDLLPRQPDGPMIRAKTCAAE